MKVRNQVQISTSSSDQITSHIFKHWQKKKSLSNKSLEKDFFFSFAKQE